MNKEHDYDLEAIIKILAGKFSEIEEIYLFGSRRYKTGSTRSDIDILLTTSKRIKHSDLRDFTLENNSALDLFVLSNGTATSVANESYIESKTNDQLIKDLNAVLLYDRTSGGSEELTNRKTIKVDKRVGHEMTVLPNTSSEYYEVQALLKYFHTAAENGLTAKPYLGTSTDEASEFIIKIMKNLVSTNHSVTNYGQAATGWTKELKNEYDFQNLFWITVKPWLPNLEREGVEVKYDNQEKRSDFSLFKNQLVIELKHIKNDGDKRAVVKTLESLAVFYSQHPNIRTLIFGILVEENVTLDDAKWETDYSYLGNTPSIKTVIIRNKV